MQITDWLEARGRTAWDLHGCDPRRRSVSAENTRMKSIVLALIPLAALVMALVDSW